MSWSSFWAFFRLDMKIVMRDRMAMGMLLLVPAGFYIFFGAFFGNISSPESAARYYNQYTVSFAAVILLSAALLNLGPMIVISKDMGFYRRLMVTPLKMSEVWLASICRILVIATVGYVEVLAVGYVLFDMLPQASLLQLAVPALVSAFMLLSMGFLLGALFNKPQTAFNAGMVIFQPMLLLSGAGFPREMFPDWASDVAVCIPFTHAIDIMRMGWAGSYFTSGAVVPTAALLASGAVCALMATYTFRKRAV